MNGDANSHPAAAANGQADPKIIQALEVIHDARSANQHRQDAYQFLEEVKTHGEAPYHGFLLASNKAHAPIIRHFGLSLLEIAIKYKWQDYSSEQLAMVRSWILQLTQAITAQDPAFLRNKIAQLWVEAAKRSWMIDWKDMDELLVNLWQGGPIEKYFVLEVLENLSENSFGKEDSVTAMRGDELSNACIDVWTPAAVFKEHYPKRDDSGIRFGEEGWLLRIADFLTWCLGQDPKDQDVASCAVKAASTLKSGLDWVLLRAIVATHIPARLCQALKNPNRALQLGALEGLFVLYSRRPQLKPEDIADLVIPLFREESIQNFRELYEWSTVDPNNIDDERYLICKKLTPLVFQLGLYVDDQPSFIFDHAELGSFFDLMLLTVQSQSLHVSIPVMHLWALFMGSNYIRQSSHILSRAGQLLRICSERLLRYEDLPTESEVAALIFLAEDVETTPERHQFLGNYARFARDVIDGIVHQQPAEAIGHLLGQTDQLVEHLYDGMPRFDKSKCSRAISPPALKLDAQASVIEAAVFGYAKWRTDLKFNHGESEASKQQQASIDGSLETWMMSLIPRHFDDPTVEHRYISIVISLATGPLRKTQSAVLAAFNYLIEAKRRFMQVQKPSINASMYELHVQDFQRYCSHQLQRLAMKGPDFLIGSYNQIEAQLNEYCNAIDPTDEDRDRALSILFVILQRAASVPETERRQKLDSFVRPCLSGWNEPSLIHATEDLNSFCSFLGIGEFANEFLALKATEIPDWSGVPLDESGRTLRTRIDATKQKLPVRLTRTLLGASLDRADEQSLAIAKTLWSQHLSTILPRVVAMVKLVISFSEPSMWANSTSETQAIVRRIMKDRFWQVGISSGTRDEFYNKVTATKGTLEGLASAIRGCVRDVRETCFKILSLMTFLGEAFYQFDELPEPLCQALYSYPNALSLHQTVALLEVSRSIIDQCPEGKKSVFLVPVMTSLFNYLDRKISMEWSTIEQRNQAASEDDDLTEEMKGESILRNLTFNAVLFIARIFDPNPNRTVPGRPPSAAPEVEGQARASRLDTFVFSQPQVFKAIIMFCTHALRMHDSRSCSYIIRVMRNILPVFAYPESGQELSNTSRAALDWMHSIGIPQLPQNIASEIREFICTEVFKACITSLHDPYFVDIQNDLASLIARILVNYAGLTPTPRNILLSLPDMTEPKVDNVLSGLNDPADPRWRSSSQQRKTILKLLAGLRGVSVAEQGKILRPQKRRQDPALGKYAQGDVSVKEEKNDDDDAALDGIADMFQGA